jgi:hypothetical protein
MERPESVEYLSAELQTLRIGRASRESQPYIEAKVMITVRGNRSDVLAYVDELIGKPAEPCKG